MRLPLKSTSSGGALKPSVARSSNVFIRTPTNHIKNSGDESKVHDHDGSFDDENGENRPEIANVGDAPGKDVDAEPTAKKELSLVERRAALFGSVHHNTQKKTWRPKQMNVDTSSDVKAITSDEVGTKQNSSSDTAHLEQSPIEEYVSTSPTEEAAFTTGAAPPVAPSPSHMDFASKKKAIFNFAKQSTSCDKLVRGGKSHFETKKDADADACDEVDIKVTENENSEDGEGKSSFDGKNGGVTDEADTVAETKESKRPIYVESPRFKKNIHAAQQFLSPPPGETTTAVYSPSPHLLKPSQMNFKTYSDDLFRRAAAHVENSKVIDETAEDEDCTENVDVQKNVDETEVGKDDAYSLMNKLNQKCSALMDFTSDKYVDGPKIVESSQSPAATQETKAAIESSPTPHLLKPSQMNFKSTYSDNLFRKTSTSAASDEDDAKPSMTDKQADFASRFSDVRSPTDFPTSFSDIVSPQTSTTSIDFSPTLTRFLYLSQRDTLGGTDSEKKIVPKKVITDIDTCEEAASQSEQVFSPLNAQMLSDMIGFTSSFSDAIVSPRKIIISPTMMARAGKPSSIDIQSSTEKDHDFASFTPSNFGGGEESGSRSSTSIADKVRFFDSSPFECESNAKFSTPGTVNLDVKTDDFTETAADNDGEKFADWGIATTEASVDNQDESGDDLGRELDNILSMPDETADEELPCVSSNDLEESIHTKSNTIFFGNRFNEDLGIMGSPGSQNENLSTIDEADEDLAAQTKLFKESLSPDLSEFYTQINSMFDRKVNDLEKRVKSATVENSVIKEEMCAQHQQIQGLMMQLESSRDMMQANQGLMEEIEELKAQLADKSKKGRGKFKFMSGKKKKINWL